MTNPWTDMTSASSIRIEDDETLPEPRVAIDVAEIGFFRGRPGPRRTVAGAPMTAPAPIFGLFLDPGGRPRRGLSVALVEAATKFYRSQAGIDLVFANLMMLREINEAARDVAMKLAEKHIAEDEALEKARRPIKKMRKKGLK